MTTILEPGEDLPLKGAQITCRGRDSDLPSEQVFFSTTHAHLSSPLGGREGGGQKFQPPKRIPAARRLTLKSERNFKNSPHRISNQDRINSYLIRSGLDYLNRSFHEEQKTRSVDDVASHLFTLIVDKVNPSSDYDAHTSGERHGFTVDQCERWSRRAAEYAVDVWTPDYFEKQAQRGAKGGRNSKRKPEYSYADFEHVKHLTHAEAADVLGVSVSTVRRMRDTYKRQPPIAAHRLDLLPEAPPQPAEQIDLDALLEGL